MSDIEKIEKLNNTAVALGKFDGFHLGHMKLVENVLKLQKKGYTGVIFTFEIKKNSVFDVKNMQNIFTPEEKRMLADATGVRKYIEYPFDDDLAAMQPEDFVSEILVDILDARYVIVGSDFHFGFKRTGNVRTLEMLGRRYGFKVIVIEKETEQDEVISATRIRRLIKTGDIQYANMLLGRNYFIMGTVCEGRQLGRTIGFPTANIKSVPGKLYPPAGVYASRILIPEMQNVKLTGITNIGTNPTVSTSENITIETHIFNFSKELYGKQIVVGLIDYVREEIKFPSVSSLQKQLEMDINLVKKKYLT